MITPADILNANILVVDDSSVNVSLLERTLRGAGYTSITTTTDPRAVCDLYREHRYDLVLLDVMMPGMDGFEVLRQLTAIETEGYLPVLVLTAQPGHKLQALQAGARDFVSKPFDQIELLHRVHNLLEVRLLLRDARRYGRLLEHYDPLTGLPNRRLFHDLLATTLARPEEVRGVVSVMFVMIDRFTALNDALGREAGGVLLRSIGERLIGCIGPMDTVARLEGGLFGLVTATPGGDPQGAGMVALRVREALRPPLEAEAEAARLSVTASIGIAVAPTDSMDADTLLGYAAIAGRDATSAGGDTYRFYSSSMNAHALSALKLEHELRDAIARDEFVLHYQPKMHITSGEWSGVEALLRWDRPGHGLVLPGEFIPALEESGLIIPVGNWVIETACRQIREWMDRDQGIIRVAVNVSGKQFLRPGFVLGIAQALRHHEIPPAALDIEITESVVMGHGEETNDVLHQLKALGVGLAIDDFGTGYSSLSYLQRFPIDTIKIDTSFIRDVTAGPDGGAIATAIISMARSLKLKVVAEGVETKPQVEFLRQHACDEIQGYFYSPPVPPVTLAQLRRDRPSTPRQRVQDAAH